MQTSINFCAKSGRTWYMLDRWALAVCCQPLHVHAWLREDQSLDKQIHILRHQDKKKEIQRGRQASTQSPPLYSHLLSSPSSSKSTASPIRRSWTNSGNNIALAFMSLPQPQTHVCGREWQKEKESHSKRWRASRCEGVTQDSGQVPDK
jgi:hypothetical protein